MSRRINAKTTTPREIIFKPQKIKDKKKNPEKKPEEKNSLPKNKDKNHMRLLRNHVSKKRVE